MLVGRARGRNDHAFHRLSKDGCGSTGIFIDRGVQLACTNHRLAQGQKSTKVGRAPQVSQSFLHGSEAGLIQRVWSAAERSPHLQPSSRLGPLCTAGYLPGRAYRSEIGSGHLLNIFYCQFVFYDSISQAGGSRGCTGPCFGHGTESGKA